MSDIILRKTFGISIYSFRPTQIEERRELAMSVEHCYNIVGVLCVMTTYYNITLAGKHSAPITQYRSHAHVLDS